MSNEPFEVYQTGFVTSDKMTLGKLRGITNDTVAVASRRDAGSQTVKRLMDLYRTGDPKVHSWEFARQVLDIAMKKIGPSPAEWLIVQYALNDYAYGTNLKFLDDTIKYLTTGQRDIQLVTWEGLVMRNPERRPGEASSQRAEAPLKALKAAFGPALKGDDIYRQWLGAREDGLADLMRTLYILFGRSDLPVD